MMQQKQTKQEKETSHGQALVEFALVIVLLIFIVFGVLDLGRVFFSMITITNAAREGARYGMEHPTDLTGIEDAAMGEAATSGITILRSDVTRTCPAGTCTPGNPIRVTVNHSFSLVMGWILPSPVSVRRSVEMMVP